MMPRRVHVGDRRYYGVVEALVIDNQDPEQRGRVKVVFPWLDGAETETEWVRVAQPYAGPDFGFVWMPEPESEVLVAFVHGDIRKPIVVGGLYNGTDRPPSSPHDEVNHKLLRTKHGHELMFDDGENKRVRLKTAGGHQLELDDDGNKVELASTGGCSVVIDDAAGTITVDTGAGQTLVLDGSSVTISGASVTLDADNSISFGQNATESLVLGLQFMMLFNAHIHASPLLGLPTSPPLTPMTPAQLSQVSKTV